MKRNLIRLISVYLCLLTAISCGLGELLFAEKDARPSSSENRMLQAFPDLSPGSLLSGSFMDDFEAYLSDAFFFRDGAAAFSDGVKRAFRLSSEESPACSADKPCWELNEDEQQALDQFLEEIDAEETPSSAGQPLPDESAQPSVVPGACEESGTAESSSVPAADGRLPTPLVTQDASFWEERPDGTIETVELFPAEKIATFARVLNEYRSVLPEDGTVSMITPMISCIANTVLYYHRAVNWDCDLPEVVQPYLADGVRYFDQTDILRPYIGQYTLYPTIDHHWHPISCKLSQAEMLRAQGVISNSYNEYLYWLDNVRDAGPFTAQELEDVTRSMEQVPVLLLNAPAESYIITHLNKRSPGMLMVREFDGYPQYLGGNRHPWREFITGFHTGRHALVIGDSFDLVFVAYLFPYYDKIMVTDFRDGSYIGFDVGASVQEYIDYYDIDDIYIVYCSYDSPNSVTIQDRMERFFYMSFED